MHNLLVSRPEVARRDFHDEGHGYDMFGLHLPTLRRAMTRGGWLADHYFRTRSYGVEHIPRSGAAILVANHGGALPVDAALVCLDVDRATGRVLRPIADRFVPALPLISTWFARVGAVVGTHANVGRLLERGELIAIWPEGSAGIAKPVRDRYQMKEWRVGHAELALRYRVPVVPVAVLGSEESWPVLGRITRFRGFGAPFLPVPLTPFPLPLRHHLLYGAPLALHEGLGVDAADDPGIVAHAATRVRLALARLLQDARDARAGRLA
ncbi:MAG TPA: lysophospholipid acyltransferase family protein [Kofleriaceae bacterium]|nr:lysophospholipid acyltransferase family protein [Kofleriaceae bacterium]